MKKLKLNVYANGSVTVAHASANIGYNNKLSTVYTVLINDIPQDVQNQVVLNLYKKTGDVFPQHNNFTANFQDLGTGKIINKTYPKNEK
jgi:hypothetical protein